MGPCVPFTPALLTLSLRITLHIYLISSLLFILLYVACVMVNKAVKRKKIRQLFFCIWWDLWLGIVHHVCGEHKWNEGQCSHGPLIEMEGGKEYLEIDSKAAKELKKILLDREWLKSLEFYVFFRYSSYLVQYLLLCDCGDHTLTPS